MSALGQSRDVRRTRRCPLGGNSGYGAVHSMTSSALAVKPRKNAGIELGPD